MQELMEQQLKTAIEDTLEVDVIVKDGSRIFGGLVAEAFTNGVLTGRDHEGSTVLLQEDGISGFIVHRQTPAWYSLD